MINARLTGAARTLILTLRARAEEQMLGQALLHDPWSADWYKFMPEYRDYEAWYNPAFQLATVIRSRLIDDAAIAFIESHEFPLVVELGAGLSTRYYRIGEGRTKWIESDLEQAIVLRRKLDVEVDNHWFLPGNLADLAWLDKLPDVNPKNTLFIAEGMLMFSEPQHVNNFFEVLSAEFSEATFLFDVVNPGYIDSVSEEFKALRSPMLWGIYPEDLRDYHLSVLNTRYLLLEFPERWEAIGIEAHQRKKERSGYVIEAIIG